MDDGCVREILPNASDFKQFWKDKGPFRYALTSAEYPPVLLEPEEWVFGNDVQAVLKALMGFSREKMAFVKAPFNPENKAVLRPEDLSAWRISHFPEDWNMVVSDIFVPEGHLTLRVTDEVRNQGLPVNADTVAETFFCLLASAMDEMGYVLLAPRGKAKSASISDYLAEWEEDEADAGIG